MSNLSNNWFCDGNADFEYKKYLLLAYLQYVNRHFKETRLYPGLAELVNHYRNLHHFLDSKRKLDEGFPKQVDGIDMNKLRLVYKKVLKEENILDTIEHLVKFSLPKIKSYLDNGKEIYDFIEDNLRLYAVGIVPMRKEEGYMILAGHRKDLLVYNYVMSIFSTATDSYRSLQTKFVKSYKRNLVNTLPNIKTDLLRSFKQLPNPATYVVETEINIPVRETFLPIAKKMLVAHLMQAG
ncbi:hypothetical protein GC194_13085 [bacterium]|nr:hypothetical protein [bacterium]